MGFFEFVGIAVCLYYFISVLLWIYLDSNIELFFYEKFGKPISTLRGKVIWITGASSGIGKHLALELAKHGVKLCISARRDDELQKVKETCLSMSQNYLTSNDILVLKMDMLEIDKHDEYFQKVLTHFDGQLDVLVNNAGRTQRANWEDIDVSVDRDLFELDVFSVLNLSRIYVRHIESNAMKGHLVVTSSLSGVIIAPFSASYAGAKFAINAYYEALKMEKPHIDVTIINPGPVFSNILENAFTGKNNKIYSYTMKPTDNRLSLERCSIQIATAIANKLHICCNGLFPWMLLAYIWKCFPNLRYLIPKFLGNEGWMKFRESKKVSANYFK